MIKKIHKIIKNIENELIKSFIKRSFNYYERCLNEENIYY